MQIRVEALPASGRMTFSVYGALAPRAPMADGTFIEISGEFRNFGRTSKAGLPR